MANGQEMAPKGQRTSVSQTEQIAITCSDTESKDVRSSGVCLAVCATVHSIRGGRPDAWEAFRKQLGCPEGYAGKSPLDLAHLLH